MDKRMSLSARKELVSSLVSHYREARYTDRRRILDEFIAATGYHRKYAISLLNQRNGSLTDTHKATRTRPRVYSTDVQEALVTLWKTAGRICSKRLVPILPEFIDVMERHGHLNLPDEIRLKLLRISPATVDRLLQDVRRGKRKGVGTTRHGALLKHQIPIRTFSDWDDLKPGFLEADLVAHCGTSVHGTYLNTLVLTDVATGWTECLALWCRDQSHVMEALEEAHMLLPVPFLGLDTDNGSEFLNELLLSYCNNKSITFTRCRPYKKNDQCYVEQKNGSIVRRFIGYDRFEGAAACRHLAALYGVLRLHVNFFQPFMKLISKHRQGSKVIKRYDQARTPYSRILTSPDVAEEIKAALTATYLRLDPVELLNQLEYHQDLLWQYAYRPADMLENGKSVSASLAEAPSQADRPAAPTVQQERSPRVYRRTRKPTKHRYVLHTWRTRPDPFILVWEEIEARLEQDPGQQAKSILVWLQQTYPGQFSDRQLRTLQRRVKAWRLARAGHCQGVLHPVTIGGMTGEAEIRALG